MVVDLTGRAYVNDPEDDAVVVRVLADHQVPWAESSIIKGVTVVQDEIRRSLGGVGATIEFSEVGYPATDIQPVGVAVGALLWCGDYFEFEPPRIDGSYDKDANRYRFVFADTGTEFLVDRDFPGWMHGAG